MIKTTYYCYNSYCEEVDTCSFTIDKTQQIT